MKLENSPPRNLVLIGFMGSGKTHIGRELHQHLGFPWIDMDQEIEKRTGLSIPTIFAEQGEPAFRELETKLLNELLQDGSEQHIISTGGGVVTHEANRQILRKLGFVVWLKAPPEVILERTSRNRNRPLLNTPDPARKIQELLAVREPLYASTAHLRIDTSELSAAELLGGILESARYHFACHP